MDHSTSIEVHTSDLESALELEASIVQQFSEAAPATVSVEVINTGDSEQTISGGPTLPFEPQRTAAEGHSDALYLVPEDGRGVIVTGEDGETLDADTQLVPTEPKNGCWKAKSANMGIVDIGTSVTLDPGESFAQEYVLLAHPDNAECLSHGTYTFTTVVRATEGEFDSELTVVYG